MDLRLITLFFLLSIISMLTFGFMMGMKTDDMGQMSNCPFSGGGAICQMGIFEHLSRFQRAFTGISAKIITLLFLPPLTLLLFSVCQIELLFQKQKRRFAYFKRTQNFIATFNTFLLVLSDGIVQPKLYA